MRRVLSHHFHHFENGRGGRRWRWFYQLLARDLAAITYPTEFTRNEAFTLAPWLRERTRVVRYGYTTHRLSETERRVQRQAARRELGLPAEAFLVGNGGWLIPRKRFDVFIDTAARVAGRVPRAHFVICGDGSERAALEAQVTRLGLAGRVTFTGWVPDLTRYYQAWDVCLFNSDFDTLPCTPMEAAAEGCAVVASLRYGGLAEYVRNDVNGYFSNRHDPELLAERVVALGEDPALARRLIEGGWNVLDREFSPADELAAVKGLLLGGRAGAVRT